MDVIPFLQARHFRPAARTSIDWVVIHSAEIGKSLGGAEALMRGFARQRFNAKGKEIISSAHYNVDADSTTQSVREEDIAFHAPGANRTGIGIELCCRASQSAAEWNDDYCIAMLARTARLVAAICKRWHIPVAFVNAEGLKGGYKGITLHSECTKAFGGTHEDPGPNFPLASFLDSVRAAQTGIS